MEKLKVQLDCLKIKVLRYSLLFLFSHFIFLDTECFKSKWMGFFPNTVLPRNFEKYYSEPLSNPGKNLTLKKM